MQSSIISDKGVENRRIMKTANERLVVSRLEDLEDDKFYRVEDLQAILKNLGLNYSIFTIRDYETYKCLNYKCAKRYNDPIKKCSSCGGEVRAPLIPSPRTRGGGKGVGHRRYTGTEIKNIVEIFKGRN